MKVPTMPPRGVKNPKMERMYEHVKESEEKKEGRSEEDAERIASATVNKYRSEHGKTKKKKKD
jgi:hypothetical protein